jgi:hypothetical protein
MEERRLCSVASAPAALQGIEPPPRPLAGTPEIGEQPGPIRQDVDTDEPTPTARGRAVNEIRTQQSGCPDMKHVIGAAAHPNVTAKRGELAHVEQILLPGVPRLSDLSREEEAIDSLQGLRHSGLLSALAHPGRPGLFPASCKRAIALGIEA